MLTIGILSRDLKYCANWELKLFDEIYQSSNLKLEVFFIEEINQGSSLFSTKIRSNLMGRIFYHIQKRIENFIFRIAQLDDRSEIIRRLSQIRSENLVAVRKGYVDRFDAANVNKVASLNLDVVLRHAFNIIRGDILNASRYGIWSLHHGDNRINRGGPPGFWEILYKQKTIGVTLQVLKEELDGGHVIGRSFYNVHWSMEKNRKVAYEGSVSLVMKHLVALSTTAEIEIIDSPVYYYPLLKIPKLKVLWRYEIQFYRKLFTTLVANCISFVGLRRRNIWQLYLSDGQLVNSPLYKAKALPLPKGEFWADPFMISKEGYDYIFFERYFYGTRKGCIACVVLKDGDIKNVDNVIVKPYHMSYPFLFEDEDNLFIIPETADNDRLEVYICTDFPYNWELYSTAFHGEKILDPTLYKDDNGELWLFVNRVNKFGDMDNSELYIYRVDSLKFNTIESHKQNPVILDSSVARNAGSIFNSNGELYRPSQSNIEGIYGRALNLNKIESLSINEYKEFNTNRVMPCFKENLIGIHHIHQKSNKFVFDACSS